MEHMHDLPLQERDYSAKILSIVRSGLSDEEIRNSLLEYHENDIAGIFEELSAEERERLFSILGIEVMSDVVSFLDDAGEYLSEIDADDAAEIIENMDADEALEVLQTVVASADALEATKNEALLEISRIALDIEKESNIETLVKAKGFADCVAVLGDDSVSVIVRQEGDLLQNQIVQIKEIVYEETGILPSGVKIIKK